MLCFFVCKIYESFLFTFLNLAGQIATKKCQEVWKVLLNGEIYVIYGAFFWHLIYLVKHIEWYCDVCMEMIVLLLQKI